MISKEVLYYMQDLAIHPFIWLTLYVFISMFILCKNNLIRIISWHLKRNSAEMNVSARFWSNLNLSICRTIALQGWIHWTKEKNALPAIHCSAAHVPTIFRKISFFKIVLKENKFKIHLVSYCTPWKVRVKVSSYKFYTEN